MLAAISPEQTGGQAQVGHHHQPDEGQAQVVEVGGQQSQHCAPTRDVEQVQKQPGQEATVRGLL